MTSSNTSIVPNSASSPLGQPNQPNGAGPPPRMPNVPNNMRMSMGPGGPVGPPGQQGPPPGAAGGPGGGPTGPMAPGQMYGNNMMSSDPAVRMRAQNSGRYRLGNPSASMRQPMQPGPQGGPPSGGPPGGMTVPTGQQSPMGNPGNIPNMPNPGMRQQVCPI